MKILRTLILFPLRMSVALFWMAWSIVDWGIYPGWLFPGRAPIFYGKDDQFVLYLKRRGWRYYSVMKCGLACNASEALYTSKLPIHTFELRDDELAVGSYVKGSTYYSILNLTKPEISPTAQRVIPGIIFKDHLMPKTVGYISSHVICADDECFTEFRVITPESDYLIGPRHPGRALGDPCLSNSENLLAFSDADHVYVCNLQTGKQTIFPTGKHVLSNWSHTDILLACSFAKNSLVLIDGLKEANQQIELPKAEGDIRNGVISPTGKYIAYWISSRDGEEGQDARLRLYSIEQRKHSDLSKWAMILDVKWSRNEKSLSIAGVKRRDICEISYGRKMRNAYTHDKEIISLDGQILALCP